MPMPPDAVLTHTPRNPDQQSACMVGIWHILCSWSSVPMCVGHVWHREAVAPWTRRSCPVDVTQDRHRHIMRRHPMATEAQETAGLIGSDKVEGTPV
jgi:hypothetical protein